MKNSKYNIFLLLITVLPVIVSGQSEIENNKKGFKQLWMDRAQTRMVTQVFTAYEFNDNKFQMAKFVLKPELKLKLNKNLRFTGIARFYGELLDNLEPGRPAQDASSNLSKRLLIGDRLEVELREFYLDWQLGKKGALRLGKQQIVWGQTDGLKLLDVVNPQNFREFMLEEFEDSRIPLWAVKAQFPIKKLGVELVWIPDLSYHDIPGFDAPYFPVALMPQPPKGMPINILSVAKPDHIISDADIGTKLSVFINGWGLSLNYLYHYDDLPVLNSKINFGSNGEPSVSIQPQYKRVHTIGGTFNNAFGPITLRGELAYNIKRHFMTASMDKTNGVAESDQFMFAVGVDWLFDETMISIQSFHDILIREIDAYNRNKYEFNISLLFAQELLNDDLKLELLLVQNLNYGDGMIIPKASYYARSNLKLIVGSDIFYGSRKGLFGQYHNKSRFFVGMEWGI